MKEKKNKEIRGKRELQHSTYPSFLEEKKKEKKEAKKEGGKGGKKEQIEEKSKK